MYFSTFYVCVLSSTEIEANQKLFDENILEEKEENWNLNSIQGFLFCYELFFRKYISRETGL